MKFRKRKKLSYKGNVLSVLMDLEQKNTLFDINISFIIYFFKLLS